VLLYNIAQSYRLAGDLNKAVFFYRAYLRVRPKASNRDEVETRLTELGRAIEEKKRSQQPPNGVAPTPPAPTPPPEPAPAPPPVAAPTPAAPAPCPRSRRRGTRRCRTAAPACAPAPRTDPSGHSQI